MKTGIELINDERDEQLGPKHNRTIEYDVRVNELRQLSRAAAELIGDKKYYSTPNGWDNQLWEKMTKKSYKKRLIIAGALIAAEIDRLQATQD